MLLLPQFDLICTRVANPISHTTPDKSCPDSYRGWESGTPWEHFVLSLFELECETSKQSQYQCKHSPYGRYARPIDNVLFWLATAFQFVMTSVNRWFRCKRELSRIYSSNWAIQNSHRCGVFLSILRNSLLSVCKLAKAKAKVAALGLV